MACSLTITGRAFPCKTGIGGIKKVWVAAFGVDWDAISGGSVAGLAGTSTATLFSFELTKNSGSLQQTVNSSIENGTVFFEQTLTMVMPIIDASSNDELYELMKGRLSVLVQDSNDNLLIMGYSEGVEVSGGEIGTGTAKGDLNGYNLTFVAHEGLPAPLLASTGGVPTDTDITLTAGS